MILYKYFPACRYSVLEDRLIRFTQRGALNDPFEMRPCFERLASFETDDAPLLAEKLAEILRQAPSRYTGKASDAISRVHAMFRELADKVRSVDPDGLQDLNRRGAAWVRDRLYEGLDSHLGILCLTEVPDNILMWAHYTEGHKGFVVGFDADHEYFQSKGPKWNPQRVVYDRQRPHVVVFETLDTFSRDIFLTKSEDWSYEKEWRVLRPLENADEVKKDAPFDIHLYRFPAGAVRSVILGARMDQFPRNHVLRSLQECPQYAQVEISECRPDNREFKLNQSPVSLENS